MKRCREKKKLELEGIKKELERLKTENPRLEGRIESQHNELVRLIEEVEFSIQSGSALTSQQKKDFEEAKADLQNLEAEMSAAAGLEETV